MIPPSPEWVGATALVGASGPSQRKEDFDYTRGKCRVVVINSTWKLAPWADVLYACDRPWWSRYGPAPDQFGGLRIVGKGEWPGCVSAGCIQPGEMRMFWDGQRIGGGWNSGFQVLNLLAYWRVARVIFTGLDCKADSEPHWHGRYKDGHCPNPKQSHFDKWKRSFSLAAPQLKDRGVEVLNASRDTALECFPRVSLEDAL